MQEIVLPTSPNWFLSSVSSGNDSGLYAFGARNLVYVYDVMTTNADPCSNNDQSRQGNTHLTMPSLIACYQEHNEKVTAVVLCPDSTQWLCCSADEMTVKLWDIRSLITIQFQNENKEKITCMTWCPCNTDLILTASEKGTLTLWKLSKNTLHNFRFEKDYVYSVKASPHHASQIAVGYRTGLVLIVDIGSDNPFIVQRIRGHETEVTSICWCPIRGEHFLQGSGDDDDGILIATASRKTVKVWSLPKGKEIWFKKLPQGASFRQDSQDVLGKRQWLDILWHKALPQYIISTSSGSHGDLFLLDICKKNDQELQHFTSTGKPKFIFNITAVGDVLCTFTLERMITVWSIKQRKVLYSMSSFGGHLYSIRASPVDPGFIAVGVGDNTIRVWNQSNKSNLLDITSLYYGTKTKITCLAWHPNKEGLIAFGTEEGRVGVCSALVSKSPTFSSACHDKTVYVVCWAPPVKSDTVAGNSTYQVYSVGDGTILQHFIGDNKKTAVNFVNAIQSVNSTEKDKLGKTELSWRKDFTVFAVGHDNGWVAVYKFPSLHQLCRITVHTKIINCIRWHPETTAESPGGSSCKNWIAFAGNGSSISVVDLSNYFVNINGSRSLPDEIKQVSCRVEGHFLRTTDLCWSPHHDGRLVSVGYDKTAIVWNMKTSEILASYEGHCGRLLTVLWSNLDPDIIMTGGFDGTLRVWKVSAQSSSVLSITERKKKKKFAVKGGKAAQNSSLFSDESVASKDELNELEELILMKKQQLMKLQQLPDRDKVHSQEIEVNEGASTKTSSNGSISVTTGSESVGDSHEENENKIPTSPVQPSGCQVSTIQPPGCQVSTSQLPSTQPPLLSEEAVDSVQWNGAGLSNEDIPSVSDLVPPVKPLFHRSSASEEPGRSTAAVSGDSTATDVSDKNRRRKHRPKSLFPVSAAANNRGRAALHEDILDLTKLVTGQGPIALYDSKPHLGIFTDRLGTHRCILQESEFHLNNDNMEYHLQLELWRGNIAGAVQIARQRNELSDWIVAMAPLASHDLWEMVSAEYAEQLEEDGQYHKAATYLLAAHKVHQAIDLFRRHRLFREAVSLARIRLSPVDPLLEDLYTEWGQNLMKDGQFEQAAKCYLAMRHIQEAGKAVTRRHDHTSLKTACHMTLLANDKQQGLSYAYRLFTQNLLMGEWQEAYKFLGEHSHLKLLLPLLSTHELLVHHLSILCPSLMLTQKPFTDASFSQWCKLDETKNKTSLPEFLVDKSDVDPVIPWEPYLICGHTFPHHLLRVWHQHLDITMVSQELTAMHSAISQLISLRQNLGDLPNLLVLISMDVTLCLLVLLTSETSSAIIHLLQALSTLHSSNNKLLLQALCRLILPQGPKYMLKLQQEFNASRVLITMECHGDVDKAGGEGHNSIKKFLTDIKDDSAITMSSLRCRELDCLRAFYYLAVLDYLHDNSPAFSQEEDILDGMPNGGKLTKDIAGLFKDKETLNSARLELSNLVQTDQSATQNTVSCRTENNPVIENRLADSKSSAYDLVNVRDTCSNTDTCAKNKFNSSHIASSSTTVLLQPGSPSDSSSPVDPPCVPSSIRQIQSAAHPNPPSHQSILMTSVPGPLTLPTDPSNISIAINSPTSPTSSSSQLQNHKGQLNYKNLVRLSKGILWDVQAKREALTETLGYIHSAIAQHLLANRSDDMSQSGSLSALSPTNCAQSFMSPTDGELEADGCCHQSRYFTLSSPSLSLAPLQKLNTDSKTDCSPAPLSSSPESDNKSAKSAPAKVEVPVTKDGCIPSIDRARSLSPLSEVKPNDKTSRGPFRSKSENSATSPSSLSVQLDASIARQVEKELLGNFDGTPVAFQKAKKILWHDTKRRSVDESLTSPKTSNVMSKITPDGAVIPLEWIDLPVDVKYVQPYVSLPLLKHEQDVVTQELKRVPDASKVPFPSTSISVRRLLDACLGSPHLNKEQKLSYFKQLNDWAMLFAVTSHQQLDTNSLFSTASTDNFSD